MLYICQLIYCSKKIFCEVRYPFYPHHFWGRHEQTTSATVNRVKVFESEEINFQPPFGSRYLYRPTSQNESLLNLLYIFFFLIIISVEHLFMSRMLMWENPGHLAEPKIEVHDACPQGRSTLLRVKTVTDLQKRSSSSSSFFFEMSDFKRTSQ